MKTFNYVISYGNLHHHHVVRRWIDAKNFAVNLLRAKDQGIEIEQRCWEGGSLQYSRVVATASSAGDIKRLRKGSGRWTRRNPFATRPPAWNA